MLRTPLTNSRNLLRNRTTNVRSYSPNTINASSSTTTAGGAGLGSATGATGAAGKKVNPNRHIVWYREIVPAMMPVIGIGTAIFFALQLLQTHLSHARSLYDAQIRITLLESELAHLQTIQRRQAASWGDSLGRVIKHVQEAAVGPKEKAVEEATKEGAVVVAGEMAEGEKKVEQIAQSVKQGGEELVDRVKREFGAERVEKRSWRNWFGFKSAASS